MLSLLHYIYIISVKYLKIALQLLVQRKHINKLQNKLRKTDYKEKLNQLTSQRIKLYSTIPFDHTTIITYITALRP